LNLLNEFLNILNYLLNEFLNFLNLLLLHFLNRLLNWLLDRLLDWLLNRLLDWLLDWLLNWLLDRLLDWLLNRLLDRLLDWLLNWLFLHLNIFNGLFFFLHIRDTTEHTIHRMFNEGNAQHQHSTEIKSIYNTIHILMGAHMRCTDKRDT
jgi:hypothetical protein